MTLIVGIFCTDGVVVAADSAATFGAQGIHTISHPNRKIEIVNEELIVAGTGQAGLGQRFVAAVQKLHEGVEFKGTDTDKAKLMAAHGISDFAQTQATKGQFGALVGFIHQGTARLCELALVDFQPEMKGDRCWYVSMGSGQTLADPYLALMRMLFWRDGPPALQGGIFSAAWVMRHAIAAAPAFVREPIDIAVISNEDRKARFLTPAELEEHLTHVDESMEHFRGFEKMLSGADSAPPLPEPNG